MAISQNQPASYTDSIREFQSRYTNTHDIVKTLQDRSFIHFFEPDSNFRVIAKFEKLNDPIGFKIPTTQGSFQQYFRYGKISFSINNTALQLIIYQSKDMLYAEGYEDYLFLPFLDATNGGETYEGGRYIDLSIKDIKDNTILVDFNKAYNPYCCYAKGYHCPIPPKENAMNISITAGEKKYTKPH